MRLFGPGPHAGGEDAEIGELPLPAGSELLQPVVLDAEPGQQLLRVLLEAVDQALDTARQQRRAAAAVDGQHDRRFGQHVVDVGLEPLRGLVDLLLARLAPTVGVEGQADDDGDQERVDQRHRRETRRERTRLPAESALPEQEERLPHLVRVEREIPVVGPGRLGQGEPGEQNRHQDEDVAQPVGAGDRRVGVAALALQRQGIGEALGVEGATQIDFRPALPTFIGGDRSRQAAHPFRGARVDGFQCAGHLLQMLGELLPLAGSGAMARIPARPKVAGHSGRTGVITPRPEQCPASTSPRFPEHVVVARLTSATGSGMYTRGAGDPRWRR